VVLSESEIPKNWGYLLLKGDRIFTKKEAPQLKPKPLTRSFFAAMMKRATGRMIHPSQIKDKIDLAVNEAIRKQAGELEKLTNAYKNIVSDVSEFEAASGLKFIDVETRAWWKDEDINLSRMGAAVKIILENEHKTDWHMDQLRKMNEQLKESSENIEKILNTYKPQEESKEPDKQGRKVKKRLLAKAE
jgi:thymidylate synthase